jgi:hypothetical protein
MSTRAQWPVSVSALFAGPLIARRLGHKIGRNCTLRYHQRHAFATLWFPGGKIRTNDDGAPRFGRCPLGDHSTLVIPVRDRNLTIEQRLQTAGHHDVRLP